MKMTGNSRMQGLIWLAALGIGLCFGSPASARAFLLDSTGKVLSEIGMLGGDSIATAVNDAGQVVGFYYYNAVGSQHAFITGPNGVGMTDLNSLVALPGGMILTSVYGINNAGEVIANGSVPNIPEPKIYALFLAGLGLIRFVGQRKKAKNPIKRY